MRYLPAFLFAISANMDNVAIGAAYGIKNRPLLFRNNLLIAVFTGAGTLFAMTAGSLLSSFLPPSTAEYLGCSLLVLMGLWFLIQPFRRRSLAAEPDSTSETAPTAETTSSAADTATIDPTENETVTLQETIVLALTLTVNNLGFGAGACMAGLPVALTALLTFLCSILFLSAGIQLGKRLGNTLLGQYADLISGITIVLLGLYGFFF